MECGGLPPPSFAEACFGARGGGKPPREEALTIKQEDLAGAPDEE
jgi:hypothetical protein